MTTSVLVVVAHPDDDVLGVGGTAYQLTQAGVPVRAAILCGQAAARSQRPQDIDLLEDTLRATEILGMGPPIVGGFPNIRMNTVDHLDLVQFIEEAMVETQATHIFTCHPADLNDDHRQTSVAAQAAARLAQRGGRVPPLRGLHFMEILSSTDWSFRGSTRFEPDAFYEIGRSALEAKQKALAAYRGVMRAYPHPRSEDALQALATLRGAAAGLQLAEAFQTAHLDLGSVIGGV
ncbi:MAG: PIG-L deacetylase family protein [Angustibacter sp.]